MWYAGIDWADDHHDVVIIDEQGHRVAACHVTHSAEGLTELVDFLQQTLAADTCGGANTAGTGLPP